MGRILHVARPAIESLFLFGKLFRLVSKVIENNSRSPLVRPRAKSRVIVREALVTLAMAGLAAGVVDRREIVVGTLMLVMAGGAGWSSGMSNKYCVDRSQQ
jgi:hypothetical protein